MSALQLVLLVVGLAALFVHVESCGFPMPAPPPPMCCAPAPPPCPPPPPCGCGKRKKREAVMPHLKTEELSCPQEGWKQLIVPQITDDATASAFAIQSAMFKKFEGKFFVSCAPANEDKPQRLAVHGDGFCVVKANDLICQVISISA
ncbi:hypothetical protein M3Y97_00696800 [Aphelenchoides bicaudatus]|nr:hypothetical protein M3Y97_00696800 [Aphelenchoides bicaudatus]